jgi:hypothetical protein
MPRFATGVAVRLIDSKPALTSLRRVRLADCGIKMIAA